MEEKFDVIVVGVGAMGSAALDHLSARGLKVLGIEQHSIAHDQGSSYGGTRLVRQAYLEHPDYVELLKRAYILWDDLDAYWKNETGEQIFHKTGCLYMGREDSAAVGASKTAADLHGLDYELLSKQEVSERFPQFELGEDEIAMFEPNAGYVVPEATLKAQVQRAKQNGAEVLTQTRVTEIDHDKGIVVTDQGSFHAEHLVVTAGAWARKWSDLNLEVERRVMYWFQPEQTIDYFARGPVYIHESEPGDNIYGFPAIDGPEGGAKVASHHLGTVTTADDLDREIHDLEIATMQERLQLIVPSLANGKFLRGHVCMYTMTPDEHFAIGRLPNHPRTVVAAGFSGHGFKFVPWVGEAIAELIEKDKPDCGVPMFAVDRANLVTDK